MKLLYAAGACSLGIHVLLEEIGKPFEVQPVKLRDGEQRKPAFTAVNPKSKVPTLLRDDGSVLTEFPAIAYYLALSNPAAKLWPAALEDQVRALETVDYVVATAHMHGFSRMFNPAAFAPSEADHDKVRARGQQVFSDALALLDRTLEGKEYVTGQFSVADAALFYLEFWAHGHPTLTLPANCAAHYQRMLARPSVQRAMQREGLH